MRLAPGGTTIDTVCGPIAVGVSLLLPALAARAMEGILAGDDLTWPMAALTGLLVLSALTGVVSGLTAVRILARVSRALRHQLLRAVLASGVAVRRRHTAGDLTTSGNSASSPRCWPTPKPAGGASGPPSSTHAQRSEQPQLEGDTKWQVTRGRTR
ncbi:6TM ABC transporter family protein [Thermocatellispora tengchongensis]|nr:hypothetical protein [Thermocatellispora tengchongensis]